MPEQRHSPRLEQVRAVKARELHKEAREALINNEPNEVILQKLTKVIQATKLCSSSIAQQIERESIDAFP